METMQVLFKKYTSSSQEDRGFFQRQIKKFLKPENVAHLLQTCHGTEGEESVLTQIMTVAGTEIIPALLHVLEVEERLSVRKRILKITAGCGSVVIPYVMNYLNSDKWYVVRNMLVLLRDLQARDAVPQIARFIQHDSAKVRLAVLQALGAIGTDTDHLDQALAIALKDEDPKVFGAAVSLLTSSKNPRHIEMIVSRLQGTNPGSESTESQLAILKAIGRVGTREWIPILLNLQQRLMLRFWNWHCQRNLRKAISEAVSEIGDREEQSLSTSPPIH